MTVGLCEQTKGIGAIKYSPSEEAEKELGSQTYV